MLYLLRQLLQLLINVVLLTRMRSLCGMKLTAVLSNVSRMLLVARILSWVQHLTSVTLL